MADESVRAALTREANKVENRGYADNGIAAFKDAAAELGARYVNVPPRLAAAALRMHGASPFEIDHSLRMSAYFATGADGAPTDHVRRVTGRPARSLDDFLSTTNH